MLKPWGLTVPLRVAEDLATLVAGLVVTTGGPVALNVVKVRSAAVRRAAAIGGHDPEMISLVRS